MKLFIASGIILSMAAFSGAQQVKLSTAQVAQAAGSQSAKPAVVPPVADVAKSTAAVKKEIKKKKAAAPAAVPAGGPVPAPGVIVIPPSVEKPAAPKPAAAPAPAKPAEVKPAAAPVKAAEAKPAAAPAPAKPAEVKPAVAPLKAAEAKPAATPASAKPVEAKPAAAPAKAVEAKPAAAPAKPAEAVKPAAPAPVAAERAKPAQPKAEAEKVPVAVPHGGFAVTRKHVVVKGETLWDLSDKYYKDPFKWGRIYTGNLDKISDPDRIYPREEIFIPEITEVVRPASGPETVTDTGAPGSEEGVAIPAVEAAAAAPAEMGEAARGLLTKEPLEDLAAAMSEEMPVDLKEWSDTIKIAPGGWDPDGVITEVIKSDTDALPGGLTVSGEMVVIKARKKGVLKPGHVVTTYMRGAVAVNQNGDELGRELQKTGLLEVVSVDGSVVHARVIEAITGVSAGQLIVR